MKDMAASLARTPSLTELGRALVEPALPALLSH